MTTKTQKLQLNIEKRDIFGKKLAASRKEGKMPAVLYGSKQKTTPIFVNFGEFNKVWKQAGESSVVELMEDGKKKVADVMITDNATDARKGDFIHADFYAVDMNKPIEASITLVFTGVAPAVKDLGGVLVKVMHEVEVEALPADLPHELNVDISALVTFDSQLMVKDIVLPKGVKALAKEDEIVALVSEHKEEVIEPTMTMDQIEVVGAKGKKEEEGVEGEEGAKEAKK